MRGVARGAATGRHVRVPDRVARDERDPATRTAPGRLGWPRGASRPGTTKNREGRTFPFTAELEQLLKDQLAEHEGLKKAQPPRVVARVFHREGEPIKDFRGAFTTACRAASCPGRILHDFGGPPVRNLERGGLSRSAAMAMVGHKTESIYRRYAIVNAGALRDAAAKIDRAAGTFSGTTTAEAKKTGAAKTA
jgi:hypothetical protein